MRVYTCRATVAELPRVVNLGDFLYFFTAKFVDTFSVFLHRFRMIKNLVFYKNHVLTRNVHIRVIFMKLFVYPNRVALVVHNLNVMLKIRLPLLIIFQPCTVFAVAAR